MNQKHSKALLITFRAGCESLPINVQNQQLHCIVAFNKKQFCARDVLAVNIDVTVVKLIFIDAGY